MKSCIARWTWQVSAFLALSLWAGSAQIPAEDATIRQEGTRWKLETAAMERVIALEDGKLVLKSFKNKASGHELVAPGTPSQEFSVAVGGGADRWSGATGGWKLVDSKVTQLSQGQQQLDVSLQRNTLQVMKSYDYTRYASSFSFSDGAVGPLRNYHAALLFPPDKTSDIPDIWNPNEYNRATWRGLLCINFDMTGDTWDPAKLEGVRELVDIYHYLESQGVVGRWVHVYRPLITGDDPTMYFQRLSRDGRRGIVIPKKPAPGPVTIKPKGLQPAETYLVSFHESAASESRTGADLMARGVRLEKMPPGELIYLNLPLHPGSKLDTEPPSPPSQATQSKQENMGYPGVELSWKAGSDNNWVFCYSADDIWGVCIYRQKLTTTGPHHLRLEVLDEHNPRSKGGIVHLDGVRIEPE